MTGFTAPTPPTVGDRTTLAVSFTVSQNLSTVTVRVVPALQPFIQVDPPSWSSLAKGQPTELLLHMAIPATAALGTIEGVIQLRSGSGKQAKHLNPPLPVTLTLLADGNSAPVARAGADQTVFVGDTVPLDGSQSSDVDGNSLSYRWALTAAPTDSLAMLANPTSVQPTFVADGPGTYVAQLIVNDGTLDSEPDAIGIEAQDGDAQPPELSLDPPDQAMLNNTTLVLTVTYRDEQSGVDPASFGVALDGMDVTDLFTLTETIASAQAALADGAHRLDASIQDRSGNLAQMVLPDGSTQALNTLSVRATEYTAGPNGPAAMPAALPPTSAYTYAVEYSSTKRWRPAPRACASTSPWRSMSRTS